MGAFGCSRERPRTNTSMGALLALEVAEGTTDWIGRRDSGQFLELPLKDAGTWPPTQLDLHHMWTKGVKKLAKSKGLLESSISKRPIRRRDSLLFLPPSERQEACRKRSKAGSGCHVTAAPRLPPGVSETAEEKHN